MVKTKTINVASKLAVVAIAGVMAGSLVACGGTSTTSSSNKNLTNSNQAMLANSNASSSASDSNSNQSQPTAGGWAIEKAGNPVLTQEQKELFDKAAGATEIIVGEPIAVIGSQVVAGTNWMYLCTSGDNNGQTGWDMVVVYKDLQDNAIITSDIPIDIANLPVAQEQKGTLTGGWVATEPNVGMVFTDDEETKAWNEAMDAEGDIEMFPVAVLGSQVVAGKNYKVLCCGKLDHSQEQYTVYAATIYAPVDGTSATFTDISPLDLTAFSGR